QFWRLWWIRRLGRFNDLRRLSGLAERARQLLINALQRQAARLAGLRSSGDKQECGCGNQRQYAHGNLPLEQHLKLGGAGESLCEIDHGQSIRRADTGTSSLTSAGAARGTRTSTLSLRMTIRHAVAELQGAHPITSWRTKLANFPAAVWRVFAMCRIPTPGCQKSLAHRAQKCSQQNVKIFIVRMSRQIQTRVVSNPCAV